MDSDDCVSGMIVLVPILKHMTLTTNKRFYFFLSSSKTCVHVCVQRHNQRVTRVIGLDKTLPAKGSLRLKKCGWCRVGRTLSNQSMGKGLQNENLIPGFDWKSNRSALKFFFYPTKGKRKRRKILTFGFHYFFISHISLLLASNCDQGKCQNIR